MHIIKYREDYIDLVYRVEIVFKKSQDYNLLSTN